MSHSHWMEESNSVRKYGQVKFETSSLAAECVRQGFKVCGVIARRVGCCDSPDRVMDRWIQIPRTVGDDAIS